MPNRIESVVNPLKRYRDFAIFQDGGRPPSWTYLGHIWTTYEGQALSGLYHCAKSMCSFENIKGLNVYTFGYLHPKIGVLGNVNPWMDSNINEDLKKNALARVLVVLAIQRENLLTSLTCRRVPQKEVVNKK